MFLGRNNETAETVLQAIVKLKGGRNSALMLYNLPLMGITEIDRGNDRTCPNGL